MNLECQTSGEQVAFLKGLAYSVARPGMMILEVGSWAGGTTVPLAEVAQEFKGKVVCVDWWKGNVGVPSMLERAKKDTIFKLFLDNMAESGYEDVVIPIKCKSGFAASLLRDGMFDLVYIDADHAYESVKRDILGFAPKVRTGGLLAGHDCEKFLKDLEPEELEFVKQNLDKDYEGRKHCGVIYAVGKFIPDHNMKYNIWYKQVTDDFLRTLVLGGNGQNVAHL